MRVKLNLIATYCALFLSCFCLGRDPQLIKENYRKLNYKEMRTRLTDLARQFPDLILHETSESKFDTPYLVDCDEEGNKCVLDIITVTDLDTVADDKVQIYISGSLNGEPLGAQIAFYLIEYLVTNFKHDTYLKQLLQTREIIITPMTNAYGYAHGKRKELYQRLDSGRTAIRDPLRDFPYSNTFEGCLNTVAARTVYRLFTDNLFVSAITFHGGFKTAISYPWGGNHLGKDTPDLKAFQVVGKAMKDAAGGAIDGGAQEFEIGDVSSTLFPSQGLVTDWAYAAGWDTYDPNGAQAFCIPRSEPALAQDFFTRSSTDNVRTAIFKVETDPLEDPSEDTYGARDVIVFFDESGDYQIVPDSIQSTDSAYNGHINRNIRLAMALIDLSKPQIVIEKIKRENFEGVDKLIVEFKFNGCTTVDEVSYMVDQEVVLLSKDGFCNHLLEEGKVQSTFTIKVDPKEQAILVAVVDKHLAVSEDTSNVEPSFFANDPQTHFVRMRTSPQLKQINHNDKVLDYSNAIVLNLTPYLAIAYEKWGLTAADILEIKDLKENAIVSPSLPPEYSTTTLEATLYQTGGSLDKMGSLSLQHVHHANDTSIPTIIYLTVENSVIEEFASYGDKCALSLTEYGDMRSFVSYEAEWGSYGTETPLVDEFDCLSANTMQGSSRTFQWQVDNLAFENVKSFPGKGLVFTNVFSWTDIGFGVFAEPDGYARQEQTAKDIIALCQEADKVSMMLYSDLDQSLHTLYAQYMPLNKELMAATNSTGVSVLIDGYYPILVDKSEITANNVTRCAKFSIIMQEVDEAENAFTYYSHGGKVEIFLTVTTIADTLTGVDQISEKNFYERVPLQCTFGFANPSYKLTMDEYCKQVLPLDLLDQVILEEEEEEQRVRKEIEDAKNNELEEDTSDEQMDDEVVDADGGDSTEEPVIEFDYEMWPDPTQDVTEEAQLESEPEEDEATEDSTNDESTETGEQPVTPDLSDASAQDSGKAAVEYDKETYPDPTAASNDESQEIEQDQYEGIDSETGSDEVASPDPSTDFDSDNEQEIQPDSTATADETGSQSSQGQLDEATAEGEEERNGKLNPEPTDSTITDPELEDSSEDDSTGESAGSESEISNAQESQDTSENENDSEIVDSSNDSKNEDMDAGLDVSTLENDNVSETTEEPIQDMDIDSSSEATQELIDDDILDANSSGTSQEIQNESQQGSDQESSTTDRKEYDQMSESASSNDSESDNPTTTTNQQGSQAVNESQQNKPQSTVTIVVQSSGEQEVTKAMMNPITTEQSYIIMICLTAILLASIGACITCCCLKCGNNSRDSQAKPFVQEMDFSRNSRKEDFPPRRLQENQTQWTREQTTSQDEEIYTGRKMVVPLYSEAEGPVDCKTEKSGTAHRMPRQVSLDRESVGRSTFDDELKPYRGGGHDRSISDAYQINDVVIEDNFEMIKVVNDKDLLRGLNGQHMASPRKSTPISIEQDVPNEISNLNLPDFESYNQMNCGHHTLPDVISSVVDYGNNSVTPGINEITPASILKRSRFDKSIRQRRRQNQHRHPLYNFSEIASQQVIQTVSQGSFIQIHKQLTGVTQVDSLEGTMMTALASGIMQQKKKIKSQRARFCPPDAFNENFRSVSLSPSSIRGGIVDDDSGHLSQVLSTVKLQTSQSLDQIDESEDYGKGKGSRVNKSSPSQQTKSTFDRPIQPYS